MKLSERIVCAWQMHLRADQRWASEVEALERDLAAERIRCQDLTARLDRARTERDDWKMTSRFWEERAYATLLVYEMREHALEEAHHRTIETLVDAVSRSNRQTSELARLNAAIQERDARITEMTHQLIDALHGDISAPVDTRTGEVTVGVDMASGPEAVFVNGVRQPDRPAPEATQEWAVWDACEFADGPSHSHWRSGVVAGFDAPAGLIVIESVPPAKHYHGRRKEDVRRPIPPTAMEPRMALECTGCGVIVHDASRGCSSCGDTAKGSPIRWVEGTGWTPADALEPTIEGGRGLDAITDEDHDLEDLARRRVTERAEVSESSERALAAKNLRISHLEARESALAECAELLGVLYPERWFNVPEYARRTIVDRDKALAAIANRDTRIADLERRLREAEAERGALNVSLDSARMWRDRAIDERDEERARAERAEERLRRVREWCVRATGSHAWALADVLAIIGEESGR